MSPSVIITVSLCAAIACSCALSLSGYVRIARTKGGWRDAGCWYGPLIFTSATFTLLAAVAGSAKDIAAFALLAAAPLIVVAVRASRFWREAAKTKLGKAAAARLTLSLLWERVCDAFWNAREDLRDLLGLLRRDGARGEGARPVPVRATPGVPPWRRAIPGVPSVAADPALGSVPPPSEVAAALAASGVMVPATWAAVAAEVADHEPESDEEHVEHMDGEVAGVLTVAEAAMARAETLGDDAGLDPAYISAQFELADAYADLAAFVAQVMKRYHDTYDEVREAAAGKLLPAKRGWFGDAATSGMPKGGRAA